MGIYKRGKVYWIDYYDQKRDRVQESSQSTNRQDAEDLLTLRKSEILRGVYKQPVKITFEEFGTRYMEHAKTNKRSWLRDQQMLGNLYEYFGKERQLTEVTPVVIEGYKVHRRAKVSGATGKPGTSLAQANVQSVNRVGPLLGYESRSQSEVLSRIQYRASRR